MFGIPGTFWLLFGLIAIMALAAGFTTSTLKRVVPKLKEEPWDRVLGFVAAVAGAAWGFAASDLLTHLLTKPFPKIQDGELDKYVGSLRATWTMVGFVAGWASAGIYRFAKLNFPHIWAYMRDKLQSDAT